jgi:hypothetical protein
MTVYHHPIYRDLIHNEDATNQNKSVHEFTKSITHRFQVHEFNLATAYEDIKECAVTKEFCMLQSSCC